MLLTSEFLGLKNEPSSAKGPSTLSTSHGVEEPGQSEHSAQPKTVAFDLPSESSNDENGRLREADIGHETDDSELTIDGTVPSHRQSSSSHHHHHTASTSHQPRHPEGGSSSHSHKDRVSNKATESDSDSTIDLPDRFDSEGRPIPQRGDDPLADRIGDLIHGISNVLVDGKSRR